MGKISELLNEYRKTCYNVTHYLEIDHEKAVKLQAYTDLNTESEVKKILTDITNEAYAKSETTDDMLALVNKEIEQL